MERLRTAAGLLRTMEVTAKAPALPSPAVGSLGLCVDFNGDSGFEVDGEVILKDRNLRDQAFDQRLVKRRDGGGLRYHPA